MIDSPAQHVDDLKVLSKKTKVPLEYGTASSVSCGDEIRKKTDDFIRGTSISGYYIRMSWPKKMQFMANLVDRIHSLGTITLFLNTLYSVTGKITSYCVATQVPPIVFDKVVDDHDRMLNPEILQNTINADLQWFDSLNDRDQVAYLIALIRFSEGAMIRILYDRLKETYYKRIHELCLSRSHIKAPPPSLKSLVVIQDHEGPLIPTEHDPDDPKHKKVLQLQKHWNQTMTKLRKDIAKRMPKPKEENHDKNKSKESMKKKDKGKSKKKGSRKDSKKKMKEKNIDELDWVQLMPIWIVKRIFAYLDNATLQKAKKVNAYWKWAIGELAKDRKARKVLDKANKNLKKAAGGDCTLPDDAMLEKPKPRISTRERRLKKLELRGAILEKMRHYEAKATDTFAILIEALKVNNVTSYADHLHMFPRVIRTNSPLYKRPDYLVKDLNLICEARDDLSGSGFDLTRTFAHASETSLGSDEDISIN